MEELLRTLVNTILNEQSDEDRAKALEVLMSNSARTLVDKVAGSANEDQQAQLDQIEEEDITLGDVVRIFSIDAIRDSMTDAVVEEAGKFIEENSALVTDEKIQQIESVVNQLQTV